MNINVLIEQLQSGMPTWTWIISAAVLILIIAATWKIFTKAGEPGWKCLIPIYNAYTEFKIVYGSAGRFILMVVFCAATIIPVVGIAFAIAAAVLAILLEIDLGKAFGKSVGFIIGMILLQSIFHIILGFDSSTYLGPKNERFF